MCWRIEPWYCRKSGWAHRQRPPSCPFSFRKIFENFVYLEPKLDKSLSKNGGNLQPDTNIRPIIYNIINNITILFLNSGPGRISPFSTFLPKKLVVRKLLLNFVRICNPIVLFWKVVGLYLYNNLILELSQLFFHFRL